MTIRKERHHEAVEVLTHVHNAIGAAARPATTAGWWEREKLQVAADAAENLAANLRRDLEQLRDKHA